MSNMSYCMFSNTLRDLYDCYEALTGEDGEDHTLSEEEMEAYEDMVELCQKIVDWSERNTPHKEELGEDDEEEMTNE